MPPQTPEDFDRIKLKNRQYKLFHYATQRTFVVTGAPTSHHWWADEMIMDGKKEKKVPTSLVSYKSLVHITQLVREYIGFTQKKKVTKPITVARPPQPRTPGPLPVAYFPKQPVKLRVMQMNSARWILKDPKGQTFYLFYTKDGWTIQATEHTALDGTFIAQNMFNQESAIRELQLFLDETFEYEPEHVGEKATIYYFERSPMDIIVFIQSDKGEIISWSVEDTETIAGEIANSETNLRRKGYEVTVIERIPPMLEGAL